MKKMWQCRCIRSDGLVREWPIAPPPARPFLGSWQRIVATDVLVIDVWTGPVISDYHALFIWWRE